MSGRDFVLPGRAAGTVTREVSGEVVVIDSATGTAHNLSGESANVWRAAGTAADVDPAALAALLELGLLETPGMTRRTMLRRTGVVAAGVGIASIALPMASAAASVTTNLILDLYTEVAAYNAAHPSGAAGNSSGQFAYFKAGRNDTANTGGNTYTTAQLTATSMAPFVASNATNGKWVSGTNQVGPAGGSPFNSVAVTATETNGGGNQGNATTVRLTIPAAPSGAYSGAGKINVHAALTVGTNVWIYVLDSTGANIGTSPIHLTTGTPTTNTDFAIPQGATGQVYYIVVTAANSTTPTVQLDVTATLPHT